MVGGTFIVAGPKILLDDNELLKSHIVILRVLSEKFKCQYISNTFPRSCSSFKQKKGPLLFKLKSHNFVPQQATH